MKIQNISSTIKQYYRLLELGASDSSSIPSRISNSEKYKYIRRNHRPLIAFSVISFCLTIVSSIRFLHTDRVLWPLYGYVGLTVLYFLVSLYINLGTKDFDTKSHRRIISSYKPKIYPTVDVFLPTAGEPISVLRNTWEGVIETIAHYPGDVAVYCLDDADKLEVAELAETFHFDYVVRPDRGYFKKAGNLRHAFKVSNGDLIAIFDADFRPRYDFLDETVPYFDCKPRTGIVQTPQYFDVQQAQGWLERGAGAVQEFFYRHSQMSLQSHDASICVGSNAVYRREALAQIGGTVLIEHSEDVHTGFDLRGNGWTIEYIPIVLAKGLCPDSMNAFFKQQYRWCLGSMSLLSSRKFWFTKMKLRTRLSYISGFLYYIHTALSSFLVAIIPLSVLVLYPKQFNLINYLYIIPALLFAHVIFPAWHRSTYGMEAWSTREVYGWAHAFAIFDAITGSAMQWKPTGSKMKADSRYISFRTLQVLCNFIPGCVWVGLSIFRLISHEHAYHFIPMLLTGAYYLLISAKVTFYREPRAVEVVAAQPAILNTELA